MLGYMLLWVFVAFFGENRYINKLKFIKRRAVDIQRLLQKNSTQAKYTKE